MSAEPNNYKEKLYIPYGVGGRDEILVVDISQETIAKSQAMPARTIFIKGVSEGSSVIPDHKDELPLLFSQYAIEVDNNSIMGGSSSATGKVSASRLVIVVPNGVKTVELTKHLTGATIPTISVLDFIVAGDKRVISYESGFGNCRVAAVVVGNYGTAFVISFQEYIVKAIDLSSTDMSTKGNNECSISLAGGKPADVIKLQSK